MIIEKYAPEVTALTFLWHRSTSIVAVSRIWAAYLHTKPQTLFKHLSGIQITHSDYFVNEGLFALIKMLIYAAPDPWCTNKY